MSKGRYFASAQKKKSHRAVWVVVILVLLAALAVGLWLMKDMILPEDAQTDPPVLETEAAEPAETEQEEESSTEAPEEATPAATEAQTEPEAETEPPVDAAAAQAEKILAEMTLEEKIYQMFVVTPEQITGVGTVIQSGEATRAAIEKYPVGGIIYFSHNFISREQTETMISNIQSFSKLGLFISVDEEGGVVSRLGSNSEMGVTSFPSMYSIGETGDTEQAYDVGYTIGTEIAQLGFNLDFAPDADVFSNPNNTVIGSRAFSSDPETAAAMVAACVEGFNDSGMLCTLKHFPGHGDTGTDSHYGAAETSKTLEELLQCEFLPFKAGIEAGADFVMIGHITAPNVTEEDVPATLSKEIVTGLLRERLGFDGIIITDSMQMQAITNFYSSGDAAVKAIQAGVDIILMPQNLTGAVSGIQEALTNGELTEERIDESVLRILETKIEAGIIAGE